MMHTKVMMVWVCLLSMASMMVLAGDVDAPAPPDDAASAMYDLEDLYNRLFNGTPGTKRTIFDEPVSGPGSSGHTIDEIMVLAPQVDNSNGAAPGDVAEGKTFWGLRSGTWGLQAGTGTGSGGDCEAAVWETGQTTCYDASGNVISCAGTGQDGDLRPGVAWPNPRFTDNGNGTVNDNLTGLTWLKNANCGGSMNWQSALNYCNSLASGQCGLTDGSVAGDWRLPSRFELESLLDLEYYGPALSNAAGTAKWSEGDAFSGVQSYYFWSSTTYAGNAGYAWCVYLYVGYVRYYGKTFYYYVWPVRGGQ